MRKSKATTTHFNFELATSKNRFGDYPVMLRINRGTEKKRVKTTVFVKKADWNKEKYEVRQSDTNYESKNSTLKSLKADYEKALEELLKEGNASLENIVIKVKSKEISESFLQYAKDRTQALYDAGGIRNWKKYNGFCNKLEAFLKSIKKKDLTFAELTPTMMTKFDAFLHKLPNERHPEQLLHQNTIAVVFNIFKTLVNRAIEIDDKIKPEHNPFMKFKYKTLKTEKEKLNSTELEAIRGLDLQENSLIWHCRNYFFFSFYCAGIRAGDLIQLRWYNITTDKRLQYQMGKNHKTRDLKLVQQALDILELYKTDGAKPNDYIFPLLDDSEQWSKYIKQEQKDVMPSDLKKRMFEVIGSKNALINKELDKIRKLAGLEKRVSFHISRHSFAKAAKDAGIDNLEVKALLAHTNLSTTQKYMGDFDTEQNDAALDAIFKHDDEAALLKQLKGVNPALLQRVLAQLTV